MEKIKKEYIQEEKTKIILNEKNIRLVPAIGISQSGENFDNEDFLLEKDELAQLKINNHQAKYSQWMQELIWPIHKKNVGKFKKRNQAFFKKIGIEKHNFKKESFEEMGIDAIKNLKNKLQTKHNIEINPNETALIMGTGTMLHPNAPLPLRSDIKKSHKVLENIAQEMDFKPTTVIHEACNSFVGAISHAQENLSNSSDLKNIIILTNEKLSKIVDFEDHNTSVLFADCSTASLITKKETAGLQILGEKKRHYRSYVDKNWKPSSPKNGKDILYNDNGNKTNGIPKLRMQGGPTLEHAFKELSEGVLDLAKTLGITNIKQALSHQANKVIVEKVAKKLKQTFPEIIVPTFTKRGNTSSSSLPLLMHMMFYHPEEVLEGTNKICEQNITQKDLELNENDIIAFTVFGAGIYSRAMFLEYIN